MKLLSKLDVTKNKAVERKREIDEGAKLARKVDGLRQLSAAEESNLTKFREESLKELNKVILSKQKESDDLDEDIKIKKGIRDKLLEPLQVEFDAIDNAKKDIEKLNLDLERREETLRKATLILELEQKQLETSNKQLDTKHRYLDEQLLEAIVHTNELERLRKDSDERNANIKKQEKMVVSDLIRREAAVAIREKDAMLQQEHNKKVAFLHDKERIQLADMRATLERAIKRIKK